MMDCHFVTGVVGGSGKTFFARVLIDYFRHRRQQKVPLLVVEGDGQNSDIYDVYHSKVDEALVVSECKLLVEEGWMALFDDLEEHADRLVIINAGAQNMESIKLAADQGFVEGFSQLGRRCVTWWLITANPTTTELLVEFFDVMEGAGGLPGPVNAILNAGSGNRDDYSFYIQYARDRVRDTGGVEVSMPTLHKDIVKEFENHDRELHEAPRHLKAGGRFPFQKWRNRMVASVAEALGDE